MSVVFDTLNKLGAVEIRHDGEIGLEIETESKESYLLPDMFYWRSDKDGSLRDFGVEYILKVPISRVQMDEALDEWAQKVQRKFALIPNSNSTSVHCHINILNNSWLDVWKFIVTYSLVENLLMNVSVPERE